MPWPRSYRTGPSHLGIHLLVLVTIFALDVLKLIPVPVLYGVFLFMGLVSLGTNQFWGRMLMLFMQPSKYPVQPYTQYMKPWRMHLFTLIQLFFFALLYAVKSIKAIAIAFPICIMACIPVRLYLLPKIFTRDELILIDGGSEVKMWIANREQKEAEEQEDNSLSGDGEDNVNGDDNDKGDIESTPSGARVVGARPRRSKRSKIRSCPAGSLMFSEEQTALGPQLKPQLMIGGKLGLVVLGTGAYQDASPHTHAIMLEGIELAETTQPSSLLAGIQQGQIATVVEQPSFDLSLQ